MNPENNDPWFDALAGKAEPGDLGTRQASSLRSFFELQDQNTPALDEATQRRIMNALESKGVFAPIAEPKPVPSAGLLAQALNWLFPQGHVSGRRFAGVAAAVLAVLVLPFVLQSPAGDDDPYGIKSLPLVPDSPTAVIDSARPGQLAAQLVAALARHGVVAELRVEGADQWVKAKIPADRMAAVQTELVSMGLAVKPDGQLAVQFRHQP
jgi:hypothetical protein